MQKKSKFVPQQIKEVAETCIANDVSDDFCDHLYNVYKCFWQHPTVKSNLRIYAIPDTHFDKLELKLNELKIKK